MNKYQEALDVLSKCCIGFAEWVAPYVNKELSFDKVNTNVALLQELVDKATPNKPIILFSFQYLHDDSETLHHVMGCPKCHIAIEQYETEIPKHCHYCGQTFDRSKDEPNPTD